MGSLLEVQSPLGKGPTLTPLQSILETSSLVHNKNSGNGGPMVSILEAVVVYLFKHLLKLFNV